MSDSDESTEWVFYKDRPEWSDVKPILQNDGPYPVAQIAYSDKFRDIYNYFRAVLVSQEISERAFALCGDALEVSPTNYTVWHYRRILLQKLNKDLKEELNFSNKIIKENSKNYQVWYHRQVLVQWMNDPSEEKNFTESIFNDDPKNYHAWQHRQWVIKEFNLWEGELEYVEKLIEEDIRNNSAWNQRYFIIKNTTDMSDEVIRKEAIYTLSIIEKATHNESPWNYLRGILQDVGLTKYPEVEKFVWLQYEKDCKSPYLLGFLVDVIEEYMLGGAGSEMCEKGINICLSLAKEHDTVRKEYWNYIARNLGNLYGPEEARAHTDD